MSCPGCPANSVYSILDLLDIELPYEFSIIFRWFILRGFAFPAVFNQSHMEAHLTSARRRISCPAVHPKPHAACHAETALRCQPKVWTGMNSWGIPVRHLSVAYSSDPGDRDRKWLRSTRVILAIDLGWGNGQTLKTLCCHHKSNDGMVYDQQFQCKPELPWSNVYVRHRVNHRGGGELKLTKARIHHWPFKEPKLKVPTRCKASVREHSDKIWPYMVQYLHVRNLKILLNTLAHMCAIQYFVGWWPLAFSP